MIAAAFDARVVAVDIDEEALQLAEKIGAVATVKADRTVSVVDEIRELTGGGAHLSIDALGSLETCYNSIANLRKRGRHVQIGLMAGDDYHPSIPMELVVANELEIIGSHGMQAYEYEGMLQMISSGELQPQDLIGQTIDLQRGAQALGNPGDLQVAGVTVIDSF
jgi:alcohol dehydrogenase